MDPTIPSTMGRAPACSYGYFIRWGDVVVLRDAFDNDWPVSRVTIMQGGWGFDEEGVAKLPRPQVYDRSGNVVVQGDRVLIFFPDGDTTTPVVMGGIRSVSATDFLPTTYAPGRSVNRLAIRVRARDDQGTELGTVDVVIADDDDGTLEVTCSDEARIEAEVVRLGTADASQAVALGPLVEDQLTVLYNAIAGATPAAGSGDGGTAFQTTLVAALDLAGWPGNTGASKVKGE